jgi:hypothetical protein
MKPDPGKSDAIRRNSWESKKNYEITTQNNEISEKNKENQRTIVEKSRKSSENAPS